MQHHPIAPTTTRRKALRISDLRFWHKQTSFKGDEANIEQEQIAPSVCFLRRTSQTFPYTKVLSILFIKLPNQILIHDKRAMRNIATYALQVMGLRQIQKNAPDLDRRIN
jgi:hypothetical protein